VLAALMKLDFVDEGAWVSFQNPDGVFWIAADFANDNVFLDNCRE
jgi:hypothetical protein